MALEKNTIIQIRPGHKWCGCFAVVDEVKSFGCQAYVTIPSNDGKLPGRAYIRLNTEDFESLEMQAPFVPAEDI